MPIPPTAFAPVKPSQVARATRLRAFLGLAAAFTAVAPLAAQSLGLDPALTFEETVEEVIVIPEDDDLLEEHSFLSNFAATGDLVLIHVFNFDFSLNPAGQPQADATITVGDTVRWVWDEGVHTTTAALGQLEFWDSPLLSSGAFEYQFTHIGLYHYYSRPFGFDNLDGTAGGMAGTITVLIPEPAHLTFTLALLALLPSLLLRHRQRHP